MDSSAVNLNNSVKINSLCDFDCSGRELTSYSAEMAIFVMLSVYDDFDLLFCIAGKAARGTLCFSVSGSGL